MSTKYAIVGGKLIDGTGAEPVENSLVLVDDNGKRARMASPLLRGVGCKQVYVLQGGLNAWRRSGTPFRR